jgi:hypothetical protein
MSRGGFLEFGFTRFEEPQTPSAEVWRRLYRAWGPIVLIGAVLTVPGSILGAASRLIVVGILFAEWLRLRAYVPALNLWAARIVALVLLCVAFGLSLANLATFLLGLLPGIVALGWLYVHYNYTKWRFRSEIASR